MGSLIGKIAVVTGASKGIGAGIAKGLAASGASVVVNYATDRVGAERVVDAIVSAGGQAMAVQADVSVAADVHRLFSETQHALGPVDILVNNAGRFEFGPIESIEEAQFHHHFNTNVLGVILTTQEALKHFSPDGGSVVNIGTAGTEHPPANGLLYVASKGALNMITRVLAQELGPRNIRVNQINPGITDTEGNRRLGTMESEMLPQMIARTALRRTGMPEDIAPVAVFLASAEARWVTGEIIGASGGYS